VCLGSWGLSLRARGSVLPAGIHVLHAAGLEQGFGNIAGLEKQTNEGSSPATVNIGPAFLFRWLDRESVRSASGSLGHPGHSALCRGESMMQLKGKNSGS
jgi:hypothetical protein